MGLKLSLDIICIEIKELNLKMKLFLINLRIREIGMEMYEVSEVLFLIEV